MADVRPEASHGTFAIALLILVTLAAGCGGPALRYEILWVQDGQALFLPDATLHAGDEVSLSRETIITHPATQQALGKIDETLGRARVLMLQEKLGVLDVSRMSTPRPGDTFTVEKKAKTPPPPGVRPLGKVIYISDDEGELIAEISESGDVRPGTEIIIGIPSEIVFRKGNGIPFAVRMQIGPGGNVRSISPETRSAIIQLSQADARQQVFRGDRIYQISLTGISSWFAPPDADLIEHLLYGRDYRRALRLYRQERYIESIQAVEANLEGNPFRLEEELLLARCYQALGNYSRSRSYYERVIAARPTELEPPLSLAYLHLQFGQREEALRHLESVLRAWPQKVDLWLDAAGIYRLLEEPEKALDAYRHVLDLDPDNEEAQRNVQMQGGNQPAAGDVF